MILVYPSYRETKCGSLDKVGLNFWYCLVLGALAFRIGRLCDARLMLWSSFRNVRNIATLYLQAAPLSGFV